MPFKATIHGALRWFERFKLLFLGLLLKVWILTFQIIHIVQQ